MPPSNSSFWIGPSICIIVIYLLSNTPHYHCYVVMSMYHCTKRLGRQKDIYSARFDRYLLENSVQRSLPFNTVAITSPTLLLNWYYIPQYQYKVCSRIEVNSGGGVVLSAKASSLVYHQSRDVADCWLLGWCSLLINSGFSISMRLYMWVSLLFIMYYSS